MARVREINRMTWEDVSREDRSVILYTRKKKGGDLTPRKVPTTDRLHRILSRRFSHREKSIPWVFWHTYRSRNTGQIQKGNYERRKRLLTGLCKRAEGKRFTFHTLRHSGASVMDSPGVPLGSIQPILGHENRKTTAIYLQSIGESEREAMALFESAGNFSHTNSHISGKRAESQSG